MVKILQLFYNFYQVIQSFTSYHKLKQTILLDIKKRKKDIWTFKIYPYNDVAYYTLKNQEKVWIYRLIQVRETFRNQSNGEIYFWQKKRKILL